MRLETAPIELIKHWILDARSWILDIGYWILDTYVWQ
jgi:hypothetical protein